MSDEIRVVTINETDYIIDLVTKKIINMEDISIEFKLSESPFCESCMEVMEFFYSLGDKHDYYDCPKCKAGKHVVKDFKPRIDKEDETQIEDDVLVEKFSTHEEVRRRMEEVTDQVMCCKLTPSKLLEYVKFLSSSLEVYHYFCSYYQLYHVDSDVRAVNGEIFRIGTSQQKLQFFKDTNDLYCKKVSEYMKKFPLKVKIVIRRPLCDRPTVGIINTYIQTLFSYI